MIKNINVVKALLRYAHRRGNTKAADYLIKFGYYSQMNQIDSELLADNVDSIEH